MPSIGDVYDGGVSGVTTRRRLVAGGSVLALGTLLAVVGILVGALFPGSYTARLYTGLLLGCAAPAVLVGVAIVLPARSVLRLATAVGASITLLGVASFWYAYPEHWAGFGRGLTGVVATIYGLGILVLAYCLFAGIVTLKRRNTPGGMISLTLSSPNIIHREAASTDPGGLSSVGTFGSDPEPPAAAQSSPTSDGGVVDDEITSPDPATDRYCGNCRSFEYDEHTTNFRPYCAHHDRPLEDMEACSAWESNRSD